MKVTKMFLYSAAAIFLITAVAKVISSYGHGTILQVRDPLIGLSFKEVFRIVACVELFVSLSCVIVKSVPFRAAIVAWISTSFVVYRIGLLWVGYHRPCSCLGNLTDAIHISPGAADLAMKVILGYLLCGSYASLIWLWKLKGGESGKELKLAGSEVKG